MNLLRAIVQFVSNLYTKITNIDHFNLSTCNFRIHTPGRGKYGLKIFAQRLPNENCHEISRQRALCVSEISREKSRGG